MDEHAQRSAIIEGVWIQEMYDGGVESSKGSPSSLSLTRKYILRKKGDNHQNPTQEMHQTEAYAALHAFAMLQYIIDYPTHNGTIRLWVSKISANTTKNDYPVYRGEIQWAFNPKMLNYIVQPVRWSHKQTGGTRKVAYPMFPQRHYSRPGLPVVPHIGVNYNAATNTYDGVDCYSPEWTMTAKQQILTRLVTSQFMKTLYSMAKTYNSAPFRDFAPGEIFYLGAEMDEGSNTIDSLEFDVTTLTHQFVYEPNMPPDFTFDGISGINKAGHEYMWMSTALISGPGEPQRTVTTQVNVAQMYGSSNLNYLGLG